MSKKILFVLAALFAVVTCSSFAQNSSKSSVLSPKNLQIATKLAGKEIKAQPSKKTLQMQQKDISMQKSGRVAIVANNKLQAKAEFTTPWQKAKARRASAIVDQPEGREVVYLRSGNAYYYYWGYIFNATVSASVGKAVFAEDGNTVYLKGLISQYPIDAWFKGTINGNTITVTFPQKALDSGGTEYFLNYGSLDNSFNFTPKGDLTFNYDPETLDITSSKSAFINGTEQVALVDSKNAWSGYSDWNISMTAVKDTLVEAPEGLKTSTYSLTAEGYDGSLVQVGFSGNDVYVQGIDKNLPDTWIKGTINGNKVVFKRGQYVGADEVSGYHQYLMSAKGTQAYDPEYEEYYTQYTLNNNDIEFVYDSANKTLSQSTTFLLNAGKETVNYLYAFDKASITPFNEVAATPVAPTINSINEGGWEYYYNEYGWGYIDFNINLSDINGNYIVPEKVSYAIWTRVNGEEKQLTLTPWDYIYLEDTMNEFPYGFTENWDIYVSGANTQFYYHVIGPEAFGVQVIYRGAGEERKSEIVWAEVSGFGAEVQPAAATPSYPSVTLNENDNRIGYGFFTGNEDVNATTNFSKPETYDVAIKLGDPALEGSIIESITFPLMEVGGVSDISVFLTSQLRIENGKNVADLAVKSVTPTEAGFITVNLDKPYLIPEGGVYVGYSLTVNNVTDYEVNKTPIAYIADSNDGGFYLHTSDGFLKWLDVSDYMGSAAITVKLAGNAIKSDAATLTAHEQQYVMTGTAFTVPVTLTNYGANGIKSIDVTYSIGGKNGEQHFDTTVDAFFGKTAQIELNIPAIDTNGNYDLEVKAVKVNGKTNEIESSTYVPIIALNTVPKHRVLLEEYTGLWCGWCPRGYVALEKLAELYPDDYVLVSYHNGDDMEIMSTSAFPSNVPGYPDAWMERTTELDAYYGTGNKEFGIVDALSAQAKEFGIANIELSAELNNLANTVTVNTEVTFPFDVADGTYALEYILVADGLKNSTWGQSNYYAGGDNGYPKYMDQFSKSNDSELYGLTFNDIAVQTSTIGGIANSVPANVNADVPVSHKYTFNLSKAKNTSGKNVIQDMNNLKVVALLIDQATDKVVNANKVKIGQSTGINELTSSKSAQVVYYDLSGRKVLTPRTGMYIKATLNNGKTTSEKIMIK
ncbi:MAG: hypothetical protein IKO17_01670 [Prevotella sp.]|nr:hypothetical protein [Prevotella sp.]